MGFNHLPKDDLLLWKRFRTGDKEAYAQLVSRHYSNLYNYGSRFTTDEAFLKDCMQEMFLNLWKNRLTISETPMVNYYLLKSLRRKIKHENDRNKKSAAHAFNFFQAGEEMEQSIETALILREDGAEKVKRIRQLIKRLSKRQQEVIYLRFYSDAGIPEIAEIMHINQQSVYNLLHDALKQLRRFSAETNNVALQESLLILLPLLPQVFLKISEKVQ